MSYGLGLAVQCDPTEMAATGRCVAPAGYSLQLSPPPFFPGWSISTEGGAAAVPMSLSTGGGQTFQVGAPVASGVQTQQAQVSTTPTDYTPWILGGAALLVLWMVSK